MLHALKYEGAQDIGLEIGRMYGRELMQTEVFAERELIIPVPLHPNKLRVRGYNQSELFARGLAESIPGSSFSPAVERIVHTSTQTRKSRFERWKNVETVFSPANNHIASLRNKRILLVDDVVTTGATLESCAAVLLRNGAHSVAVACIAAA